MQLQFLTPQLCKLSIKTKTSRIRLWSSKRLQVRPGHFAFHLRSRHHVECKRIPHPTLQVKVLLSKLDYKVLLETMPCLTWHVKLSPQVHNFTPWPHMTLCGAQAKPSSDTRFATLDIRSSATKALQSCKLRPCIQICSTTSCIWHHVKCNTFCYSAPINYTMLGRVEHSPWLHSTQCRTLWYTFP